MRILLVYPNWRDSIYSTLPIGLASIASVLLKKGYEVKALDCSALELNTAQVKDYVKSYNPDVVGISSMTPMINQALDIAKATKDVSNARTVIGGVHPSLCPEGVISNENVDYVVMGEGEYSFLDLCNALRNGFQELGNINGIVYKKNGNIINNGPRELIENLDSLPFPAVHLFPLGRYKQSIGETSKFMTMISSRGCPYMCTYCVNSCNALFGKKYRTMSPERVIEEIKYYIETYKVKEIDFYDDNFTFNKERLLAICNLIIKNNLKFGWKCSSRVETINEELLKKMEQAGCYLIAYGVESGDRQILDSVNRFTDIRKVEEVFRLTHSFGIKTLAYFMIGFPDETKETIKKTVDLAIKLDPTYVQFALITPYLHTQIFEEYEKNNLLMVKDWSEFNYAGERAIPVIRSKNLSSEELYREYKKAIRKFYLRPGYVLKQFKMNFSIYGIRKNIYGFMQVLKWLK